MLVLLRDGQALNEVGAAFLTETHIGKSNAIPQSHLSPVLISLFLRSARVGTSTSDDAAAEDGHFAAAQRLVPWLVDSLIESFCKSTHEGDERQVSALLRLC